jgi:hypothetical protein
MRGDLRIDQLPQMRPEALVRALLIRSHQPRVARHIGGEDRGKTSGRGHGSGQPTLFRAIVRRDHYITTRAAGHEVVVGLRPMPVHAPDQRTPTLTPLADRDG